ncbi:MAG TPA: sulfatase-like hydrolase/transferase, partial [Anaerolineales bacterium]|nr:sulfatase-like hydrolase/transferase [Anaerolineales bacterium]
ADQSTPNYHQTVLSLSSLLNMQYLDDFTKDFQNTSIRGPINNFVQQSSVRHLLQNAGYEFVAFPSASLSTQMRDADVFLDMTVGNLNEFEGLVLSSTVANLAIDAWHLNVPVPGYNLHRQYILFSLDKLETIAKEASPKFVFVHIMAPHPPFVLDEAGNSVQPDRPFNSGDASAFMGTDEEYMKGYISEMQYLNQRVTNAVDAILSQSQQPPIIIIQGDHGPGNYFNLMEFDNTCLKERYSILNAYYFPDKNYKALYPTITPVNSFRVIFNQYFGGDFELLDDKNYYAGWFTPYVYTDVSDQAQSCEIKLPN